MYYRNDMTGMKKQKVAYTDNSEGMPVHDFDDPKLYVTPSAFRIMTQWHTLVENQDKLTLVEDKTVFVTRPKHFVGSSGTTWHSDTVKVAQEDCVFYELLVSESTYNVNTKQIVENFR